MFWKRMCKKLLGKIFKRLRKQKPTPEHKPRSWGESPFSLINTSLGGLNMPKYQPCPKCRAGAKRRFKTDFGASYLCRCGNSFVVRR